MYSAKFQDIRGLQQKVFRLIIIESETVSFQMENDWSIQVYRTGNKLGFGGSSHSFD